MATLSTGWSLSFRGASIGPSPFRGGTGRERPSRPRPGRGRPRPVRAAGSDRRSRPDGRPSPRRGGTGRAARVGYYRRMRPPRGRLAGRARVEGPVQSDELLDALAAGPQRLTALAHAPEPRWRRP